MMYIKLLAKNDPKIYNEYFSALFKEALQLMKEGEVKKAERILNKGSRMFYRLAKNGRSIDTLTTDSCSAYLCRYYRRVGNAKKLNKILSRNFIQYDGAYYSININNGIAVRMMTIEEEPTCDCAFEFAADDELISKLQKEKAF